MNTVFAQEERNNALDFAYAMGLKRPEKIETETDSAMDFAYAMGLRRTANTETFKHHRKGSGNITPQLSFI